ncbi:MAG: nitrilase-related carbon-nitrogen hydrolase [Candidatus Altiarchaeota archaeon]|nr:nitrilase-related carbon-nitrogen hydrolase [Candidatus Altiarchaeota archaeon]
MEIAQVDIKLGDKKKNLDKIVEVIKNSDSDLILFPELFTTGFDLDDPSGLAEALRGETVKAITEVCGEKIIAGSVIEKEEDRIYNTFLLITGEGVVGKYRKIHLFDVERDYFTAGSEVGVFNTRLGVIGLATCYDLRFPEQFRRMLNAEVVLLCANFPKPRMDHWEVLIRGRAIENQCFMIAGNRVGRDCRHEYFGGSMIVDPWGSVLALGSDREEFIKTGIDLRRVKEIRDKFPVLGDIKNI